MEEHVVAPEVKKSEGEAVTFSTQRFGEVTVPSERVVNFPRGLVGLPQAQRFVFLHAEETPGTFFWMQSVVDPALAFVVCEPQIFFPDYRVPLSREDQIALGIEQVEDGLVCVILVVPDDPKQITANLRGPLVINTERRIGFQLVLAGEAYPVRGLLFEASQEGESRCSS